VVDGSPILADAEAPDWARLVLVVRNGQVLEAHEIGGPQAGDFGYYLAPPQRAHDLDALFIARETAP
jgi:cell volume regulation protein A